MRERERKTGTGAWVSALSRAEKGEREKGGIARRENDVQRGLGAITQSVIDDDSQILQRKCWPSPVPETDAPLICLLVSTTCFA